MTTKNDERRDDDAPEVVRHPDFCTCCEACELAAYELSAKILREAGEAA